jgi:hypothetical protein
LPPWKRRDDDFLDLGCIIEPPKSQALCAEIRSVGQTYQSGR